MGMYFFMLSALISIPLIGNNAFPLEISGLFTGIGAFLFIFSSLYFMFESKNCVNYRNFRRLDSRYNHHYLSF